VIYILKVVPLLLSKGILGFIYDKVCDNVLYSMVTNNIAMCIVFSRLVAKYCISKDIKGFRFSAFIKLQ